MKESSFRHRNTPVAPCRKWRKTTCPGPSLIDIDNVIPFPPMNLLAAEFPPRLPALDSFHVARLNRIVEPAEHARLKMAPTLQNPKVPLRALDQDAIPFLDRGAFLHYSRSSHTSVLDSSES